MLTCEVPVQVIVAVCSQTRCFVAVTIKLPGFIAAAVGEKSSDLAPASNELTAHRFEHLFRNRKGRL